jgi:hypothetical protein
MPETKHTSMSVQTLNSASLARIQALQLSDAVKHFAGVTVKDYGGIGGLKTISVRGLGANHTAFDYDGITITDSQSGQIDLSKFSLNNVDQVSLVNGNPDNILNPARAFASGSLLSVRSIEPAFAVDKKMKTILNVKAGSFGLVAPAITFQNKITKNITNSFLAEGQYATGKYPYVLDYGGTTSREKRENTDVHIFRLEENLFLKMRNEARLFSKVYYYQSERGLPGATIYYNLHSSQRLWDRNFFAQSRFEKPVSNKFLVQLSAKYSSSYLRFLDPDYLSTVGKVDNIYRQHEVYASTVGSFTATQRLQFSLATDGFYNALDANLYQFVFPSRYTWLTAANGKWKNDYLNVQLGIVSTVVDDRVETGTAAKGYSKLSPLINVGIQPFGSDKFIFRFFYKDIFRMPTFNDLYYAGSGNKTLKPEKANQISFGLAYALFGERKSTYLSASADFYHNRVTDKIVPVPGKNVFFWSMMNIDRVTINGVDLMVKTGLALNHKVSLGLEATYTHQQVRDATPESKTYNDQLAYTPVHSGAGVFSMRTSIVNIAYNFLYASERYTLNHNIPSNYLSGYTEHGITLSKEVSIKKLSGRVGLDVLNVFNSQYEVVRNFPMPGRSFRMTVSITI